MKYSFLLFCLLLSGFLSAQSFLNERYFGVFIQHGISYYDLPENDSYHPTIIGAIYHLPFYQSQNRFNVGVDIMPQIALGRFNGKTVVEFGANVQFNFNYALSENDIISARGGAGPHFININTRRQAKGFIFSDNFAFSYRRKLNERQQMGVLFGIRHLSNAGIMQPNTGIDNLLIGVEYARLLE
ncbi:MAG: acyloxyacyl hydrolase [Bacteroidota bacterium]